MENWHIRFKEIREKHRLSQAEIGRHMGKDATQISRYERGVVKNFPNSLYKVLKTIFKEDEIEYIENGTETSSMVAEPTPSYGDAEERVALPYYPESYASAGGGAFSYLCESEPVSFSKTFLEMHLGLSSYKDIFILNATGESMEPTIADKALIFVNPLANEGDVVRDGGIYVVQCHNMMLVKRVGVNPVDHTYTLKSDNTAHNDIVLNMAEQKECYFVGRVVGVFDRL